MKYFYSLTILLRTFLNLITESESDFFKAFIKEFVIQTTFSAKEIQRKAVECNILIDLPVNDKTDSLILLAFTEKRSKEDIDQLINFLSQYK